MYILGNGGFAHELFEQLFVYSNTYTFSGFIIMNGDESLVIDERGCNKFDYHKDASFIIGTNNKHWRKLLISHFTSKYELSTKHFPNVKAKDSHVSSFASLGIGNIFCSFSLVNYDATIGNFNCVNSYATISNGCKLGNNNILSPYVGIMEQCTISDNNFFAAHSTITPKLTIGSHNTISAGECLFDSLTDKQFFQSGIVYKKP